MNSISKYAKAFKVARMELKLTQKQLADELNIGPGSIYKYENDLMKPGAKVIDKLKDFCKVRNLDEPLRIVTGEDNKGFTELDKTKKKGGIPVNAEYLIDLQKSRIDSLESELSQVKRLIKNKNLEDSTFANLDSDFDTKVLVKIGIKGMSRCIQEMKGYHRLAKESGIPIDELNKYYEVGKWFPHNDHPVNKILDKECLEEITKFTKTMPMVWDTLTQYTTKHFLTTPIVYDFNGKRVYTLCYVQVLWSMNPVEILTKNKILSIA